MPLRDRLQTSLGRSYSLERELGGGGMSHVFLAQETTLGRQVVIKTLPPDLGGAVNVDRFTREIQIAAKLHHPCIVPVLSAGIADGVPYYTMPFVEGRSLRARLDEHGELSVAEAIRVLRDVASAMAYAHEHDVVHRDIKPDNVLLSDGYALVTDFGVARALSQSAPDDDRLTATGVALGTPAYMSPEQASGDRHLDHRADIYAFGCLAYELLVGQPPFVGRSAQATLAAHMIETPDAVIAHRSAVPPALSELVGRCLEKRPADRPQSAREIVRDLEAMATPAGGTTMPEAASRRQGRWWPVLAAGVVVVAVAGALLRAHARRASSSDAAEARRVVVRTFANGSGDHTLDPLGLMAADWIARGLTETGSVDVAGTEAEIASRDAEHRTSALSTTALGQLVRARIVVGGSYFVEGDSIVAHAELTDADAGKVLLAIPAVAAPIARRQELLETLRQRVSGALAPMLDSALVSTPNVSRQPPTYEAYREYLTAEQLSFSRLPAAIEHMRRAVALDSTFTIAWLQLVSQYQRSFDWPHVDSAIAYLSARRDRLTPYERASLELRAAIFQGNHDAAYRAAAEAYRLLPRSTYAAYELSEVALLDGRVRESVRLLEPLDPEAGVLRGRVPYYNTLCRDYHALDQLRDAKRCYDRGQRQYPNLSTFIDRIPGAIGDDEAVERMLDSSLDAFRPATSTIAALYELEAHGHGDVAQHVASRVLARAKEPTTDTARALAVGQIRFWLLAFTKQWRDARQLADSVLATHPGNATALAWTGLAAAMLGDTSQARRAERAIAERSGDHPVSVQLRARARILAALGDRAGALAVLRANPSPASEWQYHDDHLYRLMRDYPPFQEFLRPKG